MQRQHDHVARLRPIQQLPRGRFFVQVGLQCGRGDPVLQQRCAQQGGHIARGPTTQHLRQILQHHPIRRELRRDGGQVADLRILAIARLAEQQAEPSTGGALRHRHLQRPRSPSVLCA